MGFQIKITFKCINVLNNITNHLWILITVASYWLYTYGHSPYVLIPTEIKVVKNINHTILQGLRWKNQLVKCELLPRHCLICPYVKEMESMFYAFFITWKYIFSQPHFRFVVNIIIVWGFSKGKCEEILINESTLIMNCYFKNTKI